jgi:hypothetical protein
MELQKFTTRYNPYQDRLCIDGQSAAGTVVRLWLTYRLSRQLVPLLARLITPVADGEQMAATLAEWALSNACLQQRPEAAVRRPSVTGWPGPNAEPPAGWLVSAIELKSSPKRAVLAFRSAEDKVVASVALQPDHLRQWLSIVYRLWRNAGWPSKEWPAWLEQAQTAAAPGSEVLH